METVTTKDRIEERTVLHAPPSRVWQILTDPREFGRLFHFELEKPLFASGSHVRGRVVHPAYEGLPVEFTIDRMDREKELAMRWHPFAVERGHDYSKEPMTEVLFRLKPQGKDTELTLIESGFERLPADRQRPALEANREGWSQVLKSLEQVVTRKA
jgi:uncharacterized protein YndB with AHSA1/START domain